MPEESLLAELALRLAKSPEDVATEGLAYILARSEPARRALDRLVSGWSQASLEPIARFRAQVVGSDGSRTDLEGQAASGTPVVIFENKFWAGLTDAQPEGYLRRLQPNGGVLCFVCPSSRLKHLWQEVTTRAQALGTLQINLDEEQLKTALVGANRALAIISWTALLDQIGSALKSSGNDMLLADLRQLSGLAARMDTTGYIPFSLSDLTAPTARHVVQCCDLVNGLVEMLLREPFANKKGLKATAGQGWYGHYLRLYNIPCQISFHAPMWHEHRHSPIWLRLYSPDWQYSDEIHRLLDGHLGPDGSIGNPDGPRWGIWVPLCIPEGREFGAVLERLRQQVLDVAQVIRSLGSHLPADANMQLPETD